MTLLYKHVVQTMCFILQVAFVCLCNVTSMTLVLWTDCFNIGQIYVKKIFFYICWYRDRINIIMTICIKTWAIARSNCLVILHRGPTQINIACSVWVFFKSLRSTLLWHTHTGSHTHALIHIHTPTHTNTHTHTHTPPNTPHPPTMSSHPFTHLGIPCCSPSGSQDPCYRSLLSVPGWGPLPAPVWV